MPLPESYSLSPQFCATCKHGAAWPGPIRLCCSLHRDTTDGMDYGCPVSDFFSCDDWSPKEAPRCASD